MRQMRLIRRDTSQYVSLGHIIHQNRCDLEAATLYNGLHSVLFNGYWFDFSFHDRASPVTLVAFTAAAPRSVESFPRFSSAATAETLGVNYLGFSDAALAGPEPVLTFWHLSTAFIDASALICEVVNKVSAETSGKNLLFFGSSAGGFAAMNYSSKFPGSAVFAMNPRVYLRHEPAGYEEYVTKTYPGVEHQSLEEKIVHNLASLYHAKRGNYVIYMQNLQDKTFLKHHFNHFRAEIGDRSDVRYFTGEWGKGHVVPPRAVYVRALRALVRNAPNWRTARLPSAEIATKPPART